MNRLVQASARLLPRGDRETVLGDLEEAGDSALRCLAGVFGLLVRRQFEPWRTWRPWLGAFGVAMPWSFLLMGFSVCLSQSYAQSQGWVASAISLVGVAWAAGFVAGSLSRGTLWVTVVCSLSPCLLCLSTFRIGSLPRICLLLYLPAAVLGAAAGVRGIRINQRLVLALALAITLLMLPAWSRTSFLLLWPTWYTAAAAARRAV